MNDLNNNLVLRHFWRVDIFTISTLLLLLLCLPQFADPHTILEWSHIRGFAYSPDENRFAIAAYDEIWLFDAHTFEKRLTLMNDTSRFGGRYSIVAFSPDSKKIASVNGNSDEIQIWDSITGEILLSFFGHTEDNSSIFGHTKDISSIMFSPDGTLLASDDSDNNIRLWDADTGQLQKIIEIDSDYLFSFTFSPDGKTIATTGYQQILLWDVETGQLLKTLKGHADKVFSVAFSPDGNTIASSGFQEILLWDPHTGKKLNTLAGHRGSVESIAFSADGGTLAGGSYQEILLWDVQKAQHIKTLSKPTIFDAGVNSIAFSPDGQKIASLSEGSLSSLIQLWDVKTGQHKLTIGEGWRHNNPAIGYSYSSVFSEDVSKAAFIGDFFQNWNYGLITCKFPIHELRSVKPPFSPIRGRITSLRKVHETPILYQSPVKAIRFSQDGKIAVTISRNDIAIWNTDSGKHKKTLKDDFAQVYSVAISPDGKTLASGNGWNNSEIRLWNIGNGRLKSILTGHTHWVDTVAFSTDGKTLVSGSRDSTIRLWDVKTGRHKTTLKMHTAGVHIIVFSKDGELFASASQDNSIIVWDLASTLLNNRPKAVYQGHTDRIVHLKFSPDSKLLASTSWDDTIQLWDIETGQHKAALKGHTSWIDYLEFSTVGGTLVSGSLDKSIRLWDTKTGTLRTILCKDRNTYARIVLSPDGRTLVSEVDAVDYNTLHLWDLKDGRHRTTIKADPKNRVFDFRTYVFSPSGTSIISTDRRLRGFYVWDVDTGKLQKTLEKRLK